jgi:DNA-binding MarR family transcriptional regulator
VPLGPALRRAWIGYQLRLDEELAAAGFADRGFPDGRVLRMCSDGGTTIARIGRELGITRQGASKIVASLRDRRYVTITPSATNGREKIVQLTTRATDYLAAHRDAARLIETRLRAELGPEVFNSIHQLLDALGADDSVRMSTVLRRLDRSG